MAFETAEKLWDIANLITGFAVAQSIATTLVVAKGEIKVLKGRDAHLQAVGGAVVCTAFYILSIWWCLQTACPAAPSEPACGNGIWGYVTGGRIFAVILFTAILLYTLYSHRRDELLEKATDDKVYRETTGNSN